MKTLPSPASTKKRPKIGVIAANLKHDDTTNESRVELVVKNFGDSEATVHFQWTEILGGVEIDIPIVPSEVEIAQGQQMSVGVPIVDQSSYAAIWSGQTTLSARLTVTYVDENRAATRYIFEGRVKAGSTSLETVRSSSNH